MNSILNSDKIGICASAICAIHCLALPVLLIIGAEAVIHVAYTETIEKVLLGTAFAVGAFAFAKGFSQHRQHHLLVLFGAGFILLCLGEYLDSIIQQRVIPATGAAIIIYAHYQNHLLKKKVCKC